MNGRSGWESDFTPFWKRYWFIEDAKMVSKVSYPVGASWLATWATPTGEDNALVWLEHRKDGYEVWRYRVGSHGDWRSTKHGAVSECRSWLPGSAPKHLRFKRVKEAASLASRKEGGKK